MSLAMALNNRERSFPSSMVDGEMKPGSAATTKDGGPLPPAKRGINPKLWGPCAWVLIHYIALSYPEKPTPGDADDYRAFFASLQHVLPCQKCRENLASHLNLIPPDKALVEGRDALFKWTVDLHNISVSEHRRPCMTLERARELYMNNTIRPQCQAQRRVEILIAFLAGTAICAGGLYVYAKRYRQIM